MIPVKGECADWGDGRSRLVSLLDVMKRFPAEEFLQLGALMGTLEALVETESGPVDLGDGKDSFVDRLKDAEKLCRESGLPLTASAAFGLRATVDSPSPMPALMLGKGFFHFHETLRQEAAMKVFMRFLPEKADYFQEPLKGWEAVVAKYPLLQDEIEESGRCYACERYTASVFHLMRVLDDSTRRIAAFLGIPYMRTWDAYLRRFEGSYLGKYPNPTAADQDWRIYFAEIRSQLYAVKDGWRNTTIHRIAKTYNDWQAMDVYNAVRALMRKVAERIP